MSALDRPLAVTFFFSAGAWRKKEEILSLRALAPRIKIVTGQQKARLPWLKLARFGDDRLPHDTNPPARWSLRHNANVVTISGIEVDYDRGSLTVEDAVHAVTQAALAGLIYTSPSHTEDAPRWRLLCPLASDHAPGDRAGLVARLHALFDGNLSRESFTLSQSYYYGSLSGNPSHVVRLIDGEFLDKRPELKQLFFSERSENGSYKSHNEESSYSSSYGDFSGGAHTELPRTPHNSKFIEAVIANACGKVRSSGDGAKHYTIRDQAILLGGYSGEGSYGKAEAVEWLMDALPGTAKDRKAARKTAIWGFDEGLRKPLHVPPLPPKPNGHTRPVGNGAETPPPFEPESPRRPIIRVLNGLRHLAADAGLKAMIQAGIPFYQRDKSLVRATVIKAKTANGEIIGVPGVVPVTIPIIARALGQSAEWEKVKSDGSPVRIDPPKEVVEQIAAMVGEWPFPPLAGVISTPTIRPDGSILSEPGYDEATGLVLISPPPMKPVKHSPTWKDAEEALSHLNTLLNEFPFAGKGSRSVAMSMILTVVLRGALLPAVPMHIVTAPQPGTGKSYLLDTAAAIATGERCPVLAWAPDPTETEKRLVGAALAGFPIIALDNVTDMLTGDFLAQATERPILQVRPLGGSAIVRIANTFSVFANGNNILSTADLVRRTLRCGLDADLENPEEREFTHDPVAMVLADRGSFIHDCLTIARAYLAAGSPHKCRQLPSFPAWSDLVRSPIVWLNWTDPIESMAVARGEDPTRQAKSALFAAWATELSLDPIGFLTSELIEKANAYDGAQHVHPTFREACLSVARDRNTLAISPERLGKWLRSAKNTRSDKLKLTVNNNDKKRPRWRLTDSWEPPSSD